MPRKKAEDTESTSVQTEANEAIENPSPDVPKEQSSDETPKAKRTVKKKTVNDETVPISDEMNIIQEEIDTANEQNVSEQSSENKITDSKSMLQRILLLLTEQFELSRANLLTKLQQEKTELQNQSNFISANIQL